MANELVNWKSKEFYVNLKPSDIPPRNHPDRKAFRDHERAKCLAGVTVNGVFIPPTLYWLRNHWAIPLEIVDEFGIPQKTLGKPTLRDNDWIIHHAYWEAEQASPKLDVMQSGSRQLGKSLNMSALLGRDLCLINLCNDLLIVGSTNDRIILLDYLDFGMENCTEMFRVPKIDQDKKSTLIRYGVKGADNKAKVKSQLHVRNTEEGQNTEVSAGVTIYRAVLDEVGKYAYSRSYETVKPAQRGKFGKRAPNILTFTGGDVKKTRDVENAFKNPDSEGILAFENDNKRTGLFLNHIYRQEFKYTTTLSEYLNVPKGSELDEITIDVSDKEKAEATWEKEYNDLLKNPDKSKAASYRIYYPREVNDMFLSVDDSPFAKFFTELTRHKDYILEHVKPTIVELYETSDGRIDYNLTDKQPIGHYPPKAYEDLDAPFVIYDFPKLTDTYFLHIGGCDPYNAGKTETSPSLGSVYIMRRGYGNLEDPYQDVMVASYAGRPYKTNDFYKKVEMLLKFYGAKLLHEATSEQFFNYFDVKQNADQYLAKTLDLQREIHPDSKAKNTYGLAATVRNQSAWLEAMLDYMEEEIGYDTNGKPVQGFTRILDPLLIDEIFAFGPDKNTDRVVAFGHMVLYNNHLKKYHKPQVKEEVEYKPTPVKKSPWQITTTGKYHTTTKSPWKI